MEIKDPINLKDAGAILGRSEKQVQRYIKRNQLMAEKGLDGRWYLSRREVTEKSSHPERVPMDALTRQIENFRIRIEQLERQVDSLSYHQTVGRADTEERLTALEDKMNSVQPPVINTPPPVAPTITTWTVVKSTSLPANGIAAGRFAADHGVNPSTFRDHYVKGIHGEKLSISSRQRSGRDQLEWYVEEQQIPEVLAFWDRNGVRHT